MLLPLVALFVVLNRTGPRHPLDAAGFWAGAGFFGMLVVLGFVSRLLGGPPLSLLPSVTFAVKTFGPEAAARYVFPPEQWISRAGWLVVPAAAAVGAIVGLVRIGRRRRRGEATRADAAAAIFQAQLLGLLGVFGAKQLRGELGYLQIRLASSWAVMAPAVLALGGQLGRFAGRFTPGRFRVVAAAWVGFVVAGCLPAGRLPMPDWVAAVPLAATPAGAVVAVLMTHFPPARVGAGVGVALLLAAVSGSTRAHFRTADSLCNPDTRPRADRCQAFDPVRRECFRTIAEVNRWSRGLAPVGRVCFGTTWPPRSARSTTRPPTRTGTTSSW